MATCMYCGSQIADGIKFCTECGAALPVEAPLDQTLATASVQQPSQDAYQPPQFQQQFNQQPTQGTYQQPQYQQAQYQQAQPVNAPVVNDSGSIGWGVLGFFIPLVGLILFLVWNKTKPRCARVAGIGALIGFCLNMIIYLPHLLT